MLQNKVSDQGLHCLPYIQQYLRYINGQQNTLFQILGQVWQVDKVSQYIGEIGYELPERIRIIHVFILIPHTITTYRYALVNK